jgi:hypothetical protein
VPARSNDFGIGGHLFVEYGKGCSDGSFNEYADQPILSTLDLLAKQKDILHTVATDTVGRLVKAAEANKGGTYFCPSCRDVLILHKSGNMGKGSRRPHFEHKIGSPCAPETILHLVAKQLVADFLMRKIEGRLPVNFAWTCTLCTEQHQGNLLKFAKTVKLETAVDRIRPDILLSDPDGKPRIAIEIVVSHAPEPEMLTFCNERDIQVVELHLTADSDLDRIEELIANPTKVHACRNKPCPKCNNRLRTKVLLLIHGKCWACERPIIVAAIDDDCMPIGPEQFTDDEIQIARKYGVSLKKRFIAFDNLEVWVNACTHCPKCVGPSHLDSQYTAVTATHAYKTEQLKIGYYCPSCDIRPDLDEAAMDAWQ